MWDGPKGKCYNDTCPCHSTTPDTEWEKLVDAIDDIMAKYHMGEHMYSPEREEIVALLTSRDTYWNEKFLSEIERVLKIQNSGVRPNSEFEKGYTTAYENMRHTIR